MSLESTQLQTLEHFEFLYHSAVEDNKVETVSAILQRMRELGWEKEAKELLGNTKLSKLVTKGCRSTWETDDPTQETL